MSNKINSMLLKYGNNNDSNRLSDISYVNQIPNYINACKYDFSANFLIQKTLKYQFDSFI